MYSMQLLLERARAWPRFSRFSGSLDPVKQRLQFTRPRLSADDILTPEEVATRLKIPESWVYEKTRARCRNPIPCLRLGRYIRFDWNAVIEWLTAGVNLETNAARASLPAKRKLVR
jgi:excisionase family DNA binding protein